MCDTYDENPYASPEGASEPALPTIHGVWRDGEEMVIDPSNAKAPKACWVTNRAQFLSRSRIQGESLLRSVFGLLIPIVLILFSCLGLLVLVLIWVLLRATILREGSAYGWLTIGPALRRFAGLFVGIALYITTMASCGIGMGWANPVMLLVILPLGAIAVLWSTYVDRITLGLYAVLDDDRMLRVRGVHPDYLHRLPTYNRSDTISATTIEPGESPFEQENER